MSTETSNEVVFDVRINSVGRAQKIHHNSVETYKNAFRQTAQYLKEYLVQDEFGRRVGNDQEGKERAHSLPIHLEVHWQ